MSWVAMQLWCRCAETARGVRQRDTNRCSELWPTANKEWYGENKIPGKVFFNLYFWGKGWEDPFPPFPDFYLPLFLFQGTGNKWWKNIPRVECKIILHLHKIGIFNWNIKIIFEFSFPHNGCYSPYTSTNNEQALKAFASLCLLTEILTVFIWLKTKYPTKICLQFWKKIEVLWWQVWTVADGIEWWEPMLWLPLGWLMRCKLVLHISFLCYPTFLNHFFKSFALNWW